MSGKRLCTLADIEDGKGRAVGERADGIIAVRQGDQVYAWRDICPHAGLPLSTLDGRVLVHKSGNIICPVHGASFDIASGACTGGPAADEALTAVEVEIVSGDVRRV